jgi:hypothetical protein
MAKILAIIDRFEGVKAVLILPENQQLIIDKKNLPGNIKEGDWLEINFCLDKKAYVKKEKMAKKILSQI